MADITTYIKLDRNILRWRWWQNRNTLQVFLWLLLEANVSDHAFENEIIHRGEVATSLKSISKSTGLTIMEVRTALKHLKLTGEVTCRTSNRYQVISIVNYNTYQDVVTGKSTGKQQAINRQLTGKQQQYKNDKNDKNEKNKGRSAPDSPSGKKSMPGRADGTVEDIPEEYREAFRDYAEYFDWRNQ